MDGANPVLAQILGITASSSDHGEGNAPATPMRQMRRAWGRAVDTAVGLSSSVLGIAQDDLDAEALIETAPEGWVILGLRGGNQAGLTGLVLIDPVLRSALTEMQTIGNLLPAPEEQRKVTRTDAAMTIPFVQTLFDELADVGFGGPNLELTGYDFCPMPDLRTVGLVMVPGGYRSWRITMDYGGGDSQGEVMIAVRPTVAAVSDQGGRDGDWSSALRGALEEAPAELDAVLCQMPMSINAIERFEVGQLLHLPGTTVGSVSLRAGGGAEEVAQARLGQVAGKRAVRVEAPHIALEPGDPPGPLAAEMAAGADGGAFGQDVAMAAIDPLDMGQGADMGMGASDLSSDRDGDAPADDAPLNGSLGIAMDGLPEE